jgi:hypothetical protein
MTLPVLTPSQRAHIKRLVSRLESLTFELRAEQWANTTPDGAEHQALATARQHLSLAQEELNSLVTSVADPLPVLPQTTDDFLTMPLMQHPAISIRLYHLLWGIYKEMSQHNNRDFSARDLLDNGLTLDMLRRVRGMGEKTMADLESIFYTHGVTIPPC